MGLFGDKDKNNIRDGKSTRELGMISQTAILYALARNGEEVLIPWADYLRYDIAIFKNGGLIRIQVKTARLSPKQCTTSYIDKELRQLSSYCMGV
jgi:hypothetical protein